jgi:GNAT superfamily N-acetyltransferase
VSSPPGIEIVDVSDATTFGLLPPCVDLHFDHRSCDYWEDEVRGSKSSRPIWWRTATASSAATAEAPTIDNPFAPPPGSGAEFNPFAPTPSAPEQHNPFAPTPRSEPRADGPEMPRKLRLLVRGRAVFGSYAKVLLVDSVPAVYAQFGPLSAYPRAQRIRDLYPRLPQSPLPAVITCVAAAGAQGHGHAQRLVRAVVDDLSARGFAAIEAYPDLTLGPAEASAASPRFWERCGFTTVADDERYPIVRIELD